MGRADELTALREPQVAVQRARQAEVGQHRTVVGVEHEVGGLDVTVQHAGGVRGSEPVQDVEQECDRPRRGERAIGLHEALQIDPARLLHDYVGLTRLQVGVHDENDARMHDGRRQLGFAAKALDHVVVKRSRRVHDLQRQPAP